MEDPVADELGRLDEVRVDVEDAEPENRLVRQVAELRDHLVARPVGRGGAELAAVVVGEADAVLAAAAHALDRRGEKGGVRETEGGREERREAPPPGGGSLPQKGGGVGPGGGAP